MAGKRIGRSLNEEHGALRVLPAAEAVHALEGALGAHAKAIVEVRKHDPSLVACVVVDADPGAIRVCRAIGFDIRPGGGGVFGLPGAECARRFPGLAARHPEFFAEPCGDTETKILLLARGVGILRATVEGGTRVLESVSNGPAPTG